MALRGAEVACRSLGSYGHELEATNFSSARIRNLARISHCWDEHVADVLFDAQRRRNSWIAMAGREPNCSTGRLSHAGDGNPSALSVLPGEYRRTCHFDGAEPPAIGGLRDFR